ncbi:apolipoprotein N-acyltransferase [Desulfobacter hydrogenophilus]|uniref:Apolipoprotein N-acyltransferase n=1 Tax=Desulfobacter hydrogenophilus TaxID=2291 RepID=A0A328FFK7_9BACT|nr:apolipoprotein N-acyltransferase [Desulfobacter hydrogenophilus]NDY71368.1 apolipoprotein N-acyltransferase [Desulfobacter hydrogenophilus]QBH12234.1 apolipoprotein N-acyltransferase [Desulfobacter hydrogenophilus]RAM03441.1 apolipoprotein N-acyltransferase [Desulfobacter hydrogenophilus]
MQFKPIYNALLPLIPALASGLMLFSAFPGPGFYPVAFFALVPLWLSIDRLDAKQAFYTGIGTGIGFYLPLIYWICPTMSKYGGLNPLAAMSCLLLLILYLSVYTGVFALAMKKIPVPEGLVPFWGAVAWVALEYIRTYLFSGFPWGVLGYSQYSNLILIQTADTFGVLGISFLLVLANGIIVTAFKALFQRAWPGKINMAGLSLGMALLCIAFIYGHFELAKIRGQLNGAPSRKISVIQANISQDRKWDKAFITETIDRYSRLSLQAIPCDLVVWPETAVPFYYGMDPVPSNRVDALVRKAGTFFLIGIPAAQPSDQGFLYYNRACMLSPLALPKGYYDKHHLVPFGEYVPFKKLLWFAQKLTAGAGDFSKGKTGVVPLKFGTGTTGVLICFEILFPNIAREFVLNGADILTTMTNDAWFGRTQAALQHFSIAVFRAVENRRSVVRAANTGISGFVDPSGAILEKTDIFTTCALTRQVPVMSGKSFYTRHGDLAAKACLVAFFLICVIKPMRKKIRRLL